MTIPAGTMRGAVLGGFTTLAGYTDAPAIGVVTGFWQNNAAAPASFRLLEDGTSFRLLEDNSSKRLLAAQTFL